MVNFSNVCNALTRITTRTAYILFAVVLTILVILAISIPIAMQSDGYQSAGSHVLDEVPLIDGHNDLPYNLYRIEHNQLKNIDLTKNISEHEVWSKVNNPASFTDIPRLRAGKVGAQFWVAYVSCQSQDKDAVALTLDQIDVIKRMVNKYSRDMELVTTAEGIWQAFNQRKIASLIAVEGGHSIDNRLGTLRLFYELGARYMTLTHTCTLPWADASPVDSNDTITKHGLSDWGKKVVKEMNRLGMMVDLSHVSKQVMLDALEVTKAPVIFSHSNAWTVHKHHRNVQDDVLDKLKENGGIIMVNFYPDFLGGDTLDKVIEHLNYIKNRIGVEHLGIGADYDGVPKATKELNDVSKYPVLFDRLATESAAEGSEPWSTDDLRKLAGLNLIRVFRAVEQVRDKERDEDPEDEPISYDDLTRDNKEQGCRSDNDRYKNDYVPPEVTATPPPSTDSTVSATTIVPSDSTSSGGESASTVSVETSTILSALVDSTTILSDFSTTKTVTS